jgi:hypothetical protein
MDIRPLRPPCRALPWLLTLVAASGALGGPEIAEARVYGHLSELLHSSTLGFPAVMSQRFGEALATGDFDCDGRDDLAVGAPMAWVQTGFETPFQEEAGAVLVFYAAPGADTHAGSTPQALAQGDALPLDTSEPFDHFGWALAAGDFDSDGCDDLAVGAPGENLGGTTFLDAGIVRVYYGSEFRLQTSGAVDVDASGVGGSVQSNADFGYALAAGDFNGPLYDDLVIGIPGQDVGGADEAGAVGVLYGSSSGLTAAGNQVWHQDVTGVLGIAATAERFGEALAVGNFGSHGPDDLAIGVPGDTGSGSAAGAVNVLYGSVSGLSSSGDQQWHRGIFAVAGEPAGGDAFGQALAAGDFDGDGLVDLAIGVPGTEVTLSSTVTDAGQLHLFLGTNTGADGYLTATGNAAANQPCDCGCPGTMKYFGSVLVAGDLDGRPGDDLVVGEPLANYGASATGAVCIRYASGADLAVQPVHQGLPGVGETNEAFDRFGQSVAIGHFGPRAFLAVGIPREDSEDPAAADIGRVVVFRDALFADGLESGSTSAWSP